MKFKLFIADWCKPCNKLNDNIKELEQAAELDTTRIEFLNIDTSEGNTEARQYNVKGVPTLIKVDDDGTAIDTHVGYRTKEQITEIFSKI